MKNTPENEQRKLPVTVNLSRGKAGLTIEPPNTATHSPLPWTWSWIDGEDKDEGKQWIEIRDSDGEEVAVLMVRDAAKWRQIVGPEREANAECIIRAVNLHAGFAATPNIVDDRELATVLAALRFHQAENLQGIDEIPDLAIRDIATDGGRLETLGFKDVDRLCERINLGTEGSYSRQWRCPDCQRVIICSYDDLAEAGAPYCSDCDREMHMV